MFISESLINRAVKGRNLAGLTVRTAKMYPGSSKRATRIDMHQEFSGTTEIRAVVADGGTQLIEWNPTFGSMTVSGDLVAYQKTQLIDPLGHLRAWSYKKTLQKGRLE